MSKLLSYILTPIFLVFFGLTLVIFQPIQWVCFNLFGYSAHKKSVDAFQLVAMWCTRLLGTRYSFNNPYKIPKNKPLIIILNHQSIYDIPPITWHFRAHHVKYVSKKELGKGIPSVSYNLRHGGSVLIDRKKPKESVEAIKIFSNTIETHKRAAVIFPEGTRSRQGVPKRFQTKGLLALFKGIPSAVIVPITVNNSWKMFPYGRFPMGLGTHIAYTIHKPIVLANNDHATLIKDIEKQITEAVAV